MYFFILSLCSKVCELEWK